MTDPDLLFTKYLSKFQGIEVYRNRVIISEGVFLKSETTILMRSISSVSLEGPTRKLKITTSDGKTYTSNVAVGKTAQEAQKAILSVL